MLDPIEQQARAELVRVLFAHSCQEEARIYKQFFQALNEAMQELGTVIRSVVDSLLIAFRYMVDADPITKPQRAQQLCKMINTRGMIRPPLDNLLRPIDNGTFPLMSAKKESGE